VATKGKPAKILQKPPEIRGLAADSRKSCSKYKIKKLLPKESSLAI